jgi:hypothetical protein
MMIGVLVEAQGLVDLPLFDPGQPDPQLNSAAPPSVQSPDVAQPEVAVPNHTDPVTLPIVTDVVADNVPVTPEIAKSQPLVPEMQGNSIPAAQDKPPSNALTFALIGTLIFIVLIGISVALYRYIFKVNTINQIQKQEDHEETLSGQPKELNELRFPNYQNTESNKLPNINRLYSAARFGSLTMKKSFTFLKNSFSRSLSRKKSSSSAENLIPEPIVVDHFMRAVGSNWPSEDDKPYVLPPGSLIADGHQQYYKVSTDGLAYPVDTLGRVISKDPVIVKCDVDELELISYPQMHEFCEPSSKFKSLGSVKGW